MPGADRSRLQGTQFTGVSCLFSLVTAGGVELDHLEGVMGNGYEDKRTRPIIWASRRDGRPNGKGAGRYEPGALTLDVEEATALLIIETLAAESPDGTSFGSTYFTMQVQLYEPDKSVDTITMTFEDCTCDLDKGDYPSTPDGLKKSFGFSYLGKDTNGLTLYDASRTT
jgi:hypothetical protein